MANPITGYTTNFKFNLTNFSQSAALVQKYEQQNWEKIDALIASILRGSLEPWKNSTTYRLYDRVIEGTSGVLFICQVPHTSPSTGTFQDARSLNPSYWLQVDTIVVSSLPTSLPSAQGIVWNNGGIICVS